ncbi:MAG: sialidase family protein [Bryobacteraceae bacterium]
MKLSRLTPRLAMVLTLVASYGKIVHAQTGVDPERLASIRERLSQVNEVLKTLPETQKRTLSSGAQNLLTVAQGWNRVEEGLGKSLGKTASHQSLAQSWSAPSAEDVDPAASVSRVSNPGADFLFSLMGAFTQSETSTAWCGNNIVTGFNDSGSFFESLLFGPGGASFSGAAISSSPGGPFRDVGYINPGADPNNFLAGDPVVTCTITPRAGAAATTTFYYTQILQTGPSRNPISAVALSRSTNGGASWEDPIAAVQKNGFSHFLDKPWSATDPADSRNIFVTYTDFDSSGTVCGVQSGVPIDRAAIELVHSADGGVTWTTPLVITEACSTAPSFAFPQGSQVSVDSGGTVYVAWESFVGATATTRALWIRNSTDHSATFASAVKIDDVIETGDGYALQGTFRSNEFPMMAVDRSSGALYVTWNDGRNFAMADSEAPDGVYHYADILIRRSTNGGATWSPAVRVNSDPLSHLFRGQSRGTDHYMPGVAVDKTGSVGVCWYDRRSDPSNLTSGRFCSTSRDGGSTWQPSLFLNGSWLPWHATDAFINPYYLGDYDSVTSDFAMVSSGFVGAYAFVNTAAIVPNQDVGSISFP